MKWKQINILDIVKSNEPVIIFDPFYGLIKVKFQQILFGYKTKKGDEKGEKRSDQIFESKNGNLTSLSNLYFQRPQDINSFLKKGEWEENSYYKITDDYAYHAKSKLEECVISSLKLVLSKYYYSSSDRDGWQEIYEFNNGSEQGRLYLEFSKKQEMIDYKVYVLEESSKIVLSTPTIQEIKKGDNYYYDGKEVQITDLYDYPNETNRFCSILIKKTNEVINVTIDGLCKLKYLPYEERENRFKVLDENINEKSLLPFLLKNGETYNLYWKEVKEAAGYIVSLYKIIDFKGNKDIYHLQDHIIDRNIKIFSITDLVGGKFVFKVSAEDRNGKIIAKSRGIVNDFPEYLVKE